jgi:tetratricopeptide (TPR) repeat protein
MRNVFLATVFVGILLAVGLAQAKSHVADAPSASSFQEADYLFTFGENPARDKQSLAVVERALSSDGGNYQWLWRAARVLYYVGDEASKNEKLGYFQKGIDLAQRAIAAQPNAVEGHFWLGANYGGYSEEKGAFKALQTVKKIRAEMETVLRLNDRYQDGAAYLALGEMDRELPRIAGGSLSRAIMRLEQGIKIAPNNLEMKLSLAQAYQEDGRKEDARRQLQDITSRSINPSRARAERDVQQKARQLLGKL